MPAKVAWISIAPVKGMRVQSLEEAELTEMGVPGDRAFFLIDETGAMVNGKRLGSLMELVPEHDLENAWLKIAFPGGNTVEGEVRTGDPETVTFFGNEESARPVHGGFSEAISNHTGQKVRLMESPPERGGVDRGKWGGVTLLGAASLNALREAGREFACAGESADPGSADPGPIDGRRFRMTFGVEGTPAYAEDGWVGQELRIGDALIRVGAHVGRCAVTTRDPESGETDLKTLHFLRYSREDVDSFEALPFGVYGQVLEPGKVRLGDPVVPA